MTSGLLSRTPCTRLFVSIVSDDNGPRVCKIVILDVGRNLPCLGGNYGEVTNYLNTTERDYGKSWGIIKFDAINIFGKFHCGRTTGDKTMERNSSY